MLFCSIWTEVIDELNDTELSLGMAVVRLLLSMALGMVVGYERKQKGQIAGIRTFALMSMGACLAMLLSIYVPQQYLGLKNGDPGRIAAQVVTGVGFIGGGAIIQMRGSVRGLTTAAGLWITAIIGMSVGVGMYWCSTIATIMCVGVLVLFEWASNLHHIGQESKVIDVVVNEIVSDLTPYREEFERQGLKLSNYYINYNYELHTTSINFVVLTPSGKDLLQTLDRLRLLAPTHSLTLSSQIDI